MNHHRHSRKYRILDFLKSAFLCSSVPINHTHNAFLGAAQFLRQFMQKHVATEAELQFLQTRVDLFRGRSRLSYWVEESKPWHVCAHCCQFTWRWDKASTCFRVSSKTKTGTKKASGNLDLWRRMAPLIDFKDFFPFFNKEQSFMELLRHDSWDPAEVIFLPNGKMKRKSQR